MKKFLILIIILFISNKLVAENITDQWSDSDFTYKDLIDSGFEVKAYDTSTLEVANGMTIMFFVTVLQKDKEVYECQEYQTFDIDMNTISLSVICRELIQPFVEGLVT